MSDLQTNAVLSVVKFDLLNKEFGADPGYYTLGATAGSTGSIATSWKVTATATGNQTSDLAICRTLSIDDQGVRSPADSSGCWK